MFKDYAKIEVTAGKGGNGAISFHREKFISKGGPDGGDGGDGGSIILRVGENTSSLQQFVQYKKFKAPDGQNGSKKNCTGRMGEDLYLDVPLGTILIEEINGKEIPIFDFNDIKKEYRLVKGGKGGFGNAHFTSSVRQLPKFREIGAEGEKGNYILEVKMIADIGLIGLPNSGKSTFLSVVTKAKPKIANYPFTTLEPNLGILEYSGKRLVIADIPGLIEGASEGKGLGHKFLKHVERTRLILHFIDINSIDPVKDYLDIKNELHKFSKTLSKKPEVLCFTKIDTTDWTPSSKELKEYLDDFKSNAKYKDKIFAISSISKKGLKPLLNHLLKIQSQAPQPSIKIKPKKINLEPIDSKVELISPGVFKISGTKIEAFAERTEFSNYQSIQRLRDIFNKIGINKELKKLSIQPGDVINIGQQSFTW